MHNLTEKYTNEIMLIFNPVMEDIVHLNAFLKREIYRDPHFLLENMKRFNNSETVYDSLKWLRKIQAHKAPNNQVITDFYMELKSLDESERLEVEEEITVFISKKVVLLVEELDAFFAGKMKHSIGKKLIQWIIDNSGSLTPKSMYEQVKDELEIELSNPEFKKLLKMVDVLKDYSPFEKELFDTEINKLIKIEVDPSERQLAYIELKLIEKGYRLNTHMEMSKEIVGKMFAWVDKGTYEEDVIPYISKATEDEIKEKQREMTNLNATKVVELVKEHFVHVPTFKFSTRKHKSLVETLNALQDITLAQTYESNYGPYLAYSLKWVDNVIQQLEREIAGN